MRRIRDFLCALAFAASTVVSVWAVVLVAQEFPGDASRQPVNVRHWLAQRDLAQESLPARSRLAWQIEQELQSGGNLAGEFSTLNAHERERLEKNLELVLKHWYLGKVNRYFDQDPKRRADWLDREIQQFETAFMRDKEDRIAPPSLPGSLPVIALVLGKLESWIQQEDPEMQQRMREFQQAVREQVVTRRKPSPKGRGSKLGL